MSPRRVLLGVWLVGLAGLVPVFTATEARAEGKKLALLVGVDKYPEGSGFRTLPYTERDDRGRRDRLVSAPPPSEPCRRFSRTRLSSQWFYLKED